MKSIRVEFLESFSWPTHHFILAFAHVLLSFSMVFCLVEGCEEREKGWNRVNRMNERRMKKRKAFSACSHGFFLILKFFISSVLFKTRLSQSNDMRNLCDTRQSIFRDVNIFQHEPSQFSQFDDTFIRFPTFFSSSFSLFYHSTFKLDEIHFSHQLKKCRLSNFIFLLKCVCLAMNRCSEKRDEIQFYLKTFTCYLEMSSRHINNWFYVSSSHFIPRESVKSFKSEARENLRWYKRRFKFKNCNKIGFSHKI